MTSLYRSRTAFKSKTTTIFLLFVVGILLFLYIYNLFPTPRISSEWYAKEPLRGIDSSQKVTRGVIEAKKSHKSHHVVNTDFSHIPSKYISSPTGLPLGNYVVMIDAGSSGSRVYVYQYKLPFTYPSESSKNDINNNNMPDISADILHVAVAEDSHHNPIVRKQEPGLSAFGENPQDAFTSIEPLIVFAADNIPAALHATTPVFIYATAGLRLIPQTQRDAILENVRGGLRRYASKGIFLFEKDDQADVITGEFEGLYGWVALNYVYNRFGDLGRTYPTGGLDPHTYGSLPRMTLQQHRQHLVNENERLKSLPKSKSTQHHSPALIVDDPSPSPSPSTGNTNHQGDGKQESRKTVGLLEIGGGSAQVAFEVGNDGNHPPDYVHRIDLTLLSCNSNQHHDKTMDGQPLHRSDNDGNIWPIGGHTYNVYSASFLGYGANAARTRYIGMIIEILQAHSTREPSGPISHHGITGDYNKRIILDPCSTYFQAEIVTATDGWGRSMDHIELLSPFKENPNFNIMSLLSIDSSFLENDEFLLIGTGDWKTCRSLLLHLLPPSPKLIHQLFPDLIPGHPDKTCDYHCPINAQYQPKLTDEILKQGFFGFSEYWFTTRDVIPIDPSKFSGELFDQLSRELCDRFESKTDFFDILDMFEKDKFPPSANERRIRQQCFKGAWMATMLHEGHGIPKSQVSKVVTPITSIEGAEVQWSLGAVLVKMTEKIKQDVGFCEHLATNNHGLTIHLENARKQFDDDENDRLQRIDYIGSEVGWQLEDYLLFVIVCVAVFFTIFFVMVSCCGATSQDRTLYKRL